MRNVSCGWLFAGRLALVLACFVTLGGCGPKQIELAPSSVDASVEDEARLESFRRILEDDGIPLTRTELQAFLSEGDIDKNLSDEEMREVQIYFKHYVHVARPVVERFLLRSQSYMPYVRGVFRQRNMPEELAYLAFVESGFNPWAVSRSQAVGLWQFMAPTGRQYGLAQDWWMDERRDPYRATEAAATYLAKLHGDFKDWHLAIAAYNAGEGKIGRALAGTGCDTFFELCRLNNRLEAKMQLKEETQEYVPRFLAMCKIMRNAEMLGFKAADPQRDPKAANIPLLQPVVALQARPGTDLAAFARELGMSWKDFADYNPAFHRYITPPERHVQVYVPRQAEALAVALLRDGKLTTSAWATYVVQRGDTLSKVSKRTGVPIAVLKEANGGRLNNLKIGQRLRIPSSAASERMKAASAEQSKPVAASSGSAANKTVTKTPALQKQPAKSPAPVSPARKTASSPAKSPAVKNYTVASGDTLASISRKHGVSLSAMREANAHLSNPDALRVGQTIKLPGHGALVADSGKKAQVPVSTYKVKSGDTMWSIARKFNITPDELLSLNNMSRGSSMVRPGDSIRVLMN